MIIPKISIIVPCYNQGHYLAEALQSVLTQTYTNWECIIVNDGSTDTTEEVAKLWITKDKRFKYFFQENEGLSSARNFGIIHSSGEFILPLDADDKLGNEYITLATSEFKKDEKLKLVYCKAKKFGAISRDWKLKPYSISLLAKDNMIFCSAIYRKSDWERVGGYDVNMIYGLEDWEFWISLLKNGGGVKQLDSIEFYYRIKKESMRKELDVIKKKEMYEYMSIKHAAFFVKQHGSFIHLDQKYKTLKKKYDKNLRSRKHIANLFFKKFFGFTIFKK